MNQQDTISDQSFRPFILIDVDILDIPLTVNAFRVYAELKRYANKFGGCFPSYKTLGQCFKGSYPNSKNDLLRQKAIAAVKELIGWGLVKKEPRKKKDESLTSNQYIITSYSEWTTTPSRPTRLPLVAPQDYPSRPPRLPLVAHKDYLVAPDDPNKIQLTRSNLELDPINSLPPTPQSRGEEEERVEFGFRIKEEEVTDKSIATLSKKAENQSPTSNPSAGTIVPAARLSTKYDSALGIRPPSPRIKYLFPEGAWLNENGQLRGEFIRDRANLWRTGDSPNSKAFGAMAIEDVEACVCSFYMKAENHPKLVAHWDAYVKKNRRYVENVQQRVSAGVTIPEVEQDKIIGLVPSLMAESVESAYSSGNSSLAQLPEKEIAKSLCVPVSGRRTFQERQLESVATVPDDMWDAIAEKLEAEEGKAILENFSPLAIPEGAESVSSYARYSDADASDYYRDLAERSNKPSNHQISTYNSQSISREAARERINALIQTKSTPKAEANAEDLEKIEKWNTLLQSGIPSVIAEVERSAIAQGYLVEDGRVFDVEF